MEPNTPTMQANEALNLQEQTPPPAQTGPSNGKTVAVVLLLIFFFPIGWILMFVWMKWPKWVKILISVLGVLSIIGMLGIIASLVLVAVNPISQLDRAKVTNLRSASLIACNAVSYCLTDSGDLTKCDSFEKLDTYTNIHSLNRDVNFSIERKGNNLWVKAETDLSNQKTQEFTCTVDLSTYAVTQVILVE